MLCLRAWVSLLQVCPSQSGIFSKLTHSMSEPADSVCQLSHSHLAQWLASSQVWHAVFLFQWAKYRELDFAAGVRGPHQWDILAETPLGRSDAWHFLPVFFHWQVHRNWGNKVTYQCDYHYIRFRRKPVDPVSRECFVISCSLLCGTVCLLFEALWPEVHVNHGWNKQ